MQSIFTRLKAAAGRPDAVALLVDGAPCTYLELLGRVEACASGLQQHGCEPGDAIAVALPNSLDFVVAALAAFAIKGVLVPLNPRFKEDELRHYIEQSQPKVIFHPPQLASVMDGVALSNPLRASTTAELIGTKPFTPPADTNGDAAAIYMFSSGSTGKSKRITRSQRQMLAEYDAMASTIGLSGNDRILCTIPLYHSHGFGNTLMAALLSGGCLVLLTAEFNARATMNTLATQDITIYPAVPFMFKMLTDTRFNPVPSLQHLRLLFSAGAALPESVSQRFFELFGKPVSQLYGSTETGALSLNVCCPLEKPKSVGLPLHDYEIEIRSDEGQRLGPDEPGEIWVRTPSMTTQYDGLPDMTEQCFADGFFFAGDIGYLDTDHYLYVTGRKKLMINVAGYKVDPLEVEEVLSRHPDVADVVVISVEHPGYGEKIKAVIVPAAEDCTDRGIIEYAVQHLAEYKVPKVIEFRSEIPRSPLGKVLRKYL